MVSHRAFLNLWHCLSLMPIHLADLPMVRRLSLWLGAGFNSLALPAGSAAALVLLQID